MKAARAKRPAKGSPFAPSVVPLPGDKKPVAGLCRVTFNIPDALLLRAIPLAGDMGVEIEKFFNLALAAFVDGGGIADCKGLLASVAAPAPGEDDCAKRPASRPGRPGVVKYCGRDIEAGEDTPLNISGLAQYFGWSRNLIYQDQQRGYALEFGTSATPRHYREWLRAYPRPARQDYSRRLELELSKLT